MGDRMAFEDRLEAAFERYVQGAPRDVDPYVVARAALAARGPGRLNRGGRALDSPAMRLAAAVVVLLLALVAAVIIGSALQREPPLPIVHGEFTPVGPLAVSGSRQAVGLADGRVLLIGIEMEDPANSIAEIGYLEIFDPTAADITRLDSHPVVRRSAPRGVVLLADGRVLLTGGDEFYGEGESRDAPTEIIDPRTGEVTTVGQLVHPRNWHTATLLEDGRVLIVGGEVDGGIQNAPAEVFDPATSSFRAIDPPNHARLYHVATRLKDGRVLLTGGYGDARPAVAEVFDPRTERFTDVAALHFGRTDHSATSLEDGRVLIVGGNGLNERGWISEEDPLASAELFDPATNAITETGPLTTERSQHTAVLLRDGTVLIAGGFNTDGSPSTTELYNPATGKFTRGGDMLDRIGNATGALLPDGQVLVAGEIAALERFDPNPVGTAAALPGPRNDGLAGIVTAIDPPSVERRSHTATLLTDGRVLVVGGRVDLTDGRVLVVGGRVWGQINLDSAELYDPRSGTWTTTGPLNEARAFHTASLLADGRVLVAGGSEVDPQGDSLVPMDSAELYDPVAGTFTAVGPMTIPRGGTSMCCGDMGDLSTTVLPDGRVLIAGGSEEPGLDLFDPRTNTFSRIPTDCQSGTVLLPDGRVLLACGPGYVVDPSTGQVEPLSDLAARQQLGRQLPDGRLLFTDRVGSTPQLFDQTGFVPGEQLPWRNYSTASFGSLFGERMGNGNSIQTITLMPDGRSLIGAARPRESNHPLRLGLTAVFDPGLVTFTEVSSPTGRYGNTATMLQDGRILFVGEPVRSPDRTDPQPPVAELLDLGLAR